MKTMIENTERILIFENTENVSQKRRELQMRMGALNNILRLGIDNETLKILATSTQAIEKFIFERWLAVNKSMALQHAAGMKNVRELYIIPTEIFEIREALMLWHNTGVNYREGNDKYSNLYFDGKQWSINEITFDRSLQMQGARLYAEGENLNRYRRCEELIALLQEFSVPWNHLTTSSVIASFIEATGQGIKPRPSAFA